MNGTVFDIQRGSFVDGPGIRTTVFFKGCNLKCKWCHNPESQKAAPQLLFYKDKCTGCGRCEKVCPNALKSCDLCGKCEINCPNGARKISGKLYTEDEIMKEILADKPFYGDNGGATFSGGECMLQTDFLLELLKNCKQNGIHTAVDTAGHLAFQKFEKILPFTDMFLYDLKSINTDVHREYVGVGNELILDNLKRLLKAKKRIWIRMPIVAGVNDSPEDAKLTAAFFEENGSPEKIELLPYHAMGENKYRALGTDPQKFEAPTAERLAELKKILNII